MSERAPAPPQDLGEAHQEQAEFDLGQKYQETLLLAKSLHEVSTTSTQEAIDGMRVAGERLLYAKPDDEGVLVFNTHGNQYHQPEDDIQNAAASYQRVIDRIASHGYLEPDTKKAFQSFFTAKELTDRVNGEVVSSNVRMWLRDGQATEDVFLKLAGDFSLEDRDVEHLKYVAKSKQNVEDNPHQGPNFLYRYSAPVLEVGMAEGELRARLGTILTHQTDEEDLISFEGVNVPTEQALSMIVGGIEGYAAQAEASKSTAKEAPKVEELTQEISEKRESSAEAFVEQLKKFAPEVSTFSDEELLSVVKTTAVNSYGSGQGYPDVSPTERHLIDVIMDRNAGFKVSSNTDNELNVEGPSWQPVSYLYANGRTGEVTRTDFDAAPSFAFGGKQIGSETFDTEKSVELRQQMFEANKKVLEVEDI